MKTDIRRFILKILYFLLVFSFFPLAASASRGDRHIKHHFHSPAKHQVQQIGELSGDLFEEISHQVQIVRFSPRNHWQNTPIIFQGGLYLDNDGSVKGLRKIEREAIKQAYHSGESIVILDASVHDIEALHALLGEGAAYDSPTDHVVAAYTLRRIHGIPTASSLSYVHFGPSEAMSPEDEPLAFTRAIDIVVDNLQLYSDPEPEPVPASGTDTASWVDTPIQTTILQKNSTTGIYNTTIQLFALHDCVNNLDQYVVTADADWTATQAKAQSASNQDGSLSSDANGNLVVSWQDGRDYCTGGTELFVRHSICRYTNYPLQYEMEVVPLSTGTVIQVNAAPAATQGTTTSYSSGFAFNIGGSVNISGNGPSAGIQAGVSWNNSTMVQVPPVLLKAGDTGNEGAYWKYVYCTSGDAGGNCTSHIQMKGTGICVDYELGDPQNGQTPDGRMSATGQSVYFKAEPDTRVGDTFDIEVTFTAELATTTTNLWYGPYFNDPGLYCAQDGQGPEGNCNCYGCSCGTTTVKEPVALETTFKVPFPSTQCTK